MDYGVYLAEMPCLIYFHPKDTIQDMINVFPSPHRWPSWLPNTVAREPGHSGLP